MPDSRTNKHDQAAVTLAAMTASDWPAVVRIYRQGIDTGHATFAAQPPATWREWRKGKINSCSIIAQQGGEMMGWAALSPVSSRTVYAGVAEVSIYISVKGRGRGIGSLLLQQLISKSEEHGIWTLQAGIFPENQASLRLFFKNGFRRVGIRQKLGKMARGEFKGRWRDVILLERRSPIVGR